MRNLKVHNVLYVFAFLFIVSCEFSDNLLGDKASIDSNHVPPISDNTDTIEADPFTPLTETYLFTGSDQAVVVPVGAQTLTVKVWGAGGGSGVDVSTTHPDLGGGAGFSTASFSVSDLPSDLLIVVGEGGYGAKDLINFGTSTYGNGGASGISTTGTNHGAAGGGLSGIFDANSFATATQSDALIIAGGGGGSGVGGSFGSNAGAGGGLVGQTSANGVTGGSQVAGGLGILAADGAALSGGAGAGQAGQNQAGGGGGSGYFGGGAGGTNSSNDRSAGGGSGYVDTGIAISHTITGGNFETVANSGDSDYLAGVGVGGPIGESSGGNGLIILIWE